MSFKKKTSCVQSVEANLLELKRKAQLEALRYHLDAYSCFPPLKDPITYPITIEEVKKLARAWKLHERRNFWKMYPTRDAMVQQLLEHAIDNKVDLSLTLKPKDPVEDDGSSEYTPVAPESPRMSSAISPNKEQRQGNIANRTQSVISPLGGFGGSIKFNGKKGEKQRQAIRIDFSTRFAQAPKTLKNYFGKGRNELSGEVLGLMSRYTSTDVKIKLVKLAKVIKNWRENNFFMEDLFGTDVEVSNGLGELSVKAIRHMNQRKRKQRKLAVHLANYTSNNPDEFKDLTKKEVEIFVSIADSEDTHTISMSAIALSNICREQIVRQALIDMNSIHKITAMIPHYHSPNVLHAASLLVYYLSCEREVEDRLYSGSFAMLQTNCSSANADTRYLAMYTLNNLLPCIERHRVCDLSIATMQSNRLILEQNEEKFTEVLKMILNMTMFTNLHSLLLDCDVLDMIAQAASKAAKHNDKATGQTVTTILNNLLFNPDISEGLVQQDYISILIDCMGINDSGIYGMGFRILASVCKRPEFDLKVFDGDVLNVINQIVHNVRLQTEVAIDAAKFLVSLSVVNSKSSAKRLLGDGVPSTLCELISSSYDSSVRIIAVQGLQNFFEFKDIAVKYVDVAAEHIFNLLGTEENVNGAYCIYNLVRFEHCANKLAKQMAHIKLLDIMCSAKSGETKSAYLQTLCRFSGREECISSWLEANLIPRLSDQVSLTSKSTWLAISKMILSIVSRQGGLSEVNIHGIEKILALVCMGSHKKGEAMVNDDVLIQCTHIIAFLSWNIKNFEVLDPIIRTILHKSDDKEVIESASVAIYNASCDLDCMKILVKDDSYLNLMIRMMRTGKASVQVTVSETLRNLVRSNDCIKLLIRGDTIADFIAIALLRTSSEEVKIVCGQAFFNMFCHENIRLQLLKGDLWWSMMRLARTDIAPVQRTSASALFQLCSEGNLYSQILRDLHIFSFVRDVISNSDEDLMGRYMLSIEYLLGEFTDELNQVELVAVLEAACHCLRNSDSSKVISGAIRAALKCAKSCIAGGETDFLKNDLVSCLESSKGLWSDDIACLRNVSLILRYLSSFDTFTKVVHLVNDLDKVMIVLVTGTNDIVVLECCAATALNYITHRAVDSEELVTAPGAMWQTLISKALYHENRLNSSSELRCIVISIYSHIFDAIKHIPSSVTVELFRGLMDEEVVKGSVTLRNISHIFSIASHHPDLSLKLVQVGIVSFMTEVLNKDADKMPGDSKFHMLQFSAHMLRNITMHPECVLAVMKSDRVSEILEACSYSKRKDILSDICSILYRSLAVNIVTEDTEKGLSPNRLIQICKSIIERDERSVIHMARYIMGVTFDKYSLNVGCAPSEVGSMFVEMNDRDAANVPGHLAGMHILPLTNIKSNLVVSNKVYSAPVKDAMINTKYTQSNSEDAAWIIEADTDAKLIEIQQIFDDPTPQKVLEVENSDPFTITTFYKTLKTFDICQLVQSDIPEDETEKPEGGEYADGGGGGEGEGKQEHDYEIVFCQACADRTAIFRCTVCRQDSQFLCGTCLGKHNKSADGYGDHMVQDISDGYEKCPEEDYNGTFDVPAVLATEFTLGELSMYKHHFILIDVDQGGTIDANELQDLTESLGQRVPAIEAKQLIQQFDDDNSGSIDFAEFVSMMLSMKKGSAIVENNALVAAIYRNQVKLLKSKKEARKATMLDIEMDLIPKSLETLEQISLGRTGQE